MLPSCCSVLSRELRQLAQSARSGPDGARFTGHTSVPTSWCSCFSVQPQPHSQQVCFSLPNVHSRENESRQLRLACEWKCCSSYAAMLPLLFSLVGTGFISYVTCSYSVSLSLSLPAPFPSCLAADVCRSSPENKVSDTVPNKSELVEVVASDAPNSPEPSGSQSRA